MILEDWQLDLMRVEEKHTPRPFAHVYEFVKNNQKMSGEDFRSTCQSITDILDTKDVNYDMLIFATGFLVFTETTLDLNAVMVKLATGINFEGEARDVGPILAQANHHLGRDKTE